jgi:arginase
MDESMKVAIVGAPLDLGASRRGVDMGPSAMRYAGLDVRLDGLGIEVEDWGNVTVEIPEVATVENEKARYLPEILGACSQLAGAVKKIRDKGQFPLVLGGDHSIAMGTLAGMSAAHGVGSALWIDAHGDMNRPETSPSGNVHGMPLATALGRTGFTVDGTPAPPWVDPDRVAVVGVRSLDPGEKDLIRELGIRVFTMHEIDRRGVADVMNEALEVIRGPGFVHVSLDVDACDPEIAPGVGTPVKGGLSYREAHLAMEIVYESKLMTSMEVVEVNPILDLADATGLLAVDLVASALGARIL